MLIIKSEHLKASERKLLSRFCHYTMDHFLAPSVQAQATIVIKFIDPRTLKGQDRKDMIEYQAWLQYDGKSHGKRHFTMSISTYVLSQGKRAKSLIVRLRHTMECIGHELTHAKQYLNNETFDYQNGDVRFKGKRYKNWEEGEAYFFSPWETEAYGHEYGLYKCFKMKMEQEKPK